MPFALGNVLCSKKYISSLVQLVKLRATLRLSTIRLIIRLRRCVFSSGILLRFPRFSSPLVSRIVTLLVVKSSGYLLELPSVWLLFFFSSSSENISKLSIAFPALFSAMTNNACSLVNICHVAESFL